MRARSPCADCAVRSRALCSALPPEQLARLRRLSYRRHYRPGRLILANGQQQEWVANVVSGVIKLTKALADGRQQIVGLLFAADFLGRPFRSHGSCAAEAATSVELCCFPRHTFEDLLRRERQLEQLMLERTLDQVDAAREWMFVLGRRSAEEKVAALIRLIVERMRVEPGEAPAGPPPIHCDLPLSRTEMADYLGLRLETVCRQLKRLRERGVIATAPGRGITVRDYAALERALEREDGSGG